MRDISFRKDKINPAGNTSMSVDSSVHATKNGYEINYSKSIADTEFFNSIDPQIEQNSFEADKELEAYNNYRMSRESQEVLEEQTQTAPSSELFNNIRSYDISPGVMLMVMEGADISEGKIKAILNLLKL